MTNLTCFWHPKKGYFDLSLEDMCEQCGRPMGYPLDNPPVLVHGPGGDLRITQSIARGYYGATYVAAVGPFNAQRCLKVIPRQIYELLDKDFTAECQRHHQVAADSQHLVDIQDFFDADIDFPGVPEPLRCHVAVLDYVPGTSLQEILDGHTPIPVRTAAQIAVDLLQMLEELELRESFHNDLHAGNIRIKSLDRQTTRSGALDPQRIAVAVDLGSARDGSRSDEPAQLADTHQVTRHLAALAMRLLPDPAAADDIDFRLGMALNDIANLLRPENLAQRPPSADDLTSLVYRAFEAATSPWKAPTSGLVRLSDSYNAQTMRAWFVPRLLVDPEKKWQSRLEAPGPLVVTGMRGCGKTMLLRALQFHARASLAEETNHNDQAATANHLKEDGYVGLYVSSTRLLDTLGKPAKELHQPYSRLFLSYAREALQALRHLREVAGESAITPGAPRPIALVLRQLISGVQFSGSENELSLERTIFECLRHLESGGDEHVLQAHPAIAFPQLAAAITACSPVWGGAGVYFLLDDVSTRNLHESSIQELLSTLMFASETCAFKVTTEAQTLELILKSPGMVEKARAGRDYESFDLASEIYKQLRADRGRQATKFVAEVLWKRAQVLSGRQMPTPLEVLGDQDLVEIAREIMSSAESSPTRKNVYWGLSALAAVCVGDIGDVISIYAMILDRSEEGQAFPVPSAVQSGVFQDYCSRRLYHLNRRQGRLKKFADGFAEAAHDLLMQSDPDRPRDYSSVYVRVTTGDFDGQFSQLRELVDAGIFVLQSGPDVPRTKTRDADPIAQHVLTYRKLLGLSRFTGLGQRDRFELSGEELIEWLDHPERGREILTRNLARRSDPRSDGQAHDDRRQSKPVSRRQPNSRAVMVPAATLFDEDEPRKPAVDALAGLDSGELPIPVIRELAEQELHELAPGVLIAGRGFEDRTLESMRRVLEITAPRTVSLVRYPLDGCGPQVEQLARARADRVELHDAGVAMRLPETGSNTISCVDTTGLSKPHIYRSVRELLQRDGRVIVVHTEAGEHYPLNADVEERLSRVETADDYVRLEACRDILTGESQPYSFIPLHPSQVDDGRRRILFAASSPKHERLFSLLEQRDYDRVEVMVPPGGSARSELARLAGRVAAHDYHSSDLVEAPTDDLTAILRLTARAYRKFYSCENYSVELGLTGSKLHCVALSAASAVLRFSQAWYVRPSNYDMDRFTRGVGPTRAYLLEAAAGE